MLLLLFLHPHPHRPPRSRSSAPRFLRLGPLPRTSSSSLSPLLHKALRSRPSPWLTVAQVLPSLMPPLPNLTPSVSVSRQRRDLWRLPMDAPFLPATSLTRPFLSSSTSVLIPRASSSMSRVSPTTRSFLVCLGSGSTNRPLTGPSSVFPSAPTIVATLPATTVRGPVFADSPDVFHSASDRIPFPNAGSPASAHSQSADIGSHASTSAHSQSADTGSHASAFFLSQSARDRILFPDAGLHFPVSVSVQPHPSCLARQCHCLSAIHQAGSALLPFSSNGPFRPRSSHLSVGVPDVFPVHLHGPFRPRSSPSDPSRLR